MKGIITAILLVSASAVFAQNTNWCGAEMPESYRQQFRAMDKSAYQPGNRAGIRWIPVFYHIVAKDDGSNGSDLKRVFETHCEMNQAYNTFDIGFYIAGIDTIKNTTIWTHANQSAGYIAFQQYNKANKCNVYVNGNLPGLCGYATYPHTGGNGGGIFVNVSCLGKATTTMHHEMGHYLGLPHTFEGWDGSDAEFVDGSNCSSAGDLFCDTPADFLDERTPCPYNGNKTDPQGDLYSTVIDETLYMSYFNDACTDRFSPMQQGAMNDILTNDRPNLLNQTLPDLAALQAATFVTPQPGETNLVSTNLSFIWNSIPNAQYYQFTLQSSNSVVTFADSILTDTVFVVNTLAPNKSYKFKVRGISFGNTCAVAQISTITTSQIKALVAVTVPSCPGQADGDITINPSNGTPPYTFAWSNGSTDTAISNLPSGVYSVTITDANGKVGTTVVTIPGQGILGVSINKVGANLNADAAGGTPPYTYTWSNGTNGQFNNNISFGNYTVTITDSKGCISSENFVFSSLGVDMDLKISMKVFPNPASSSLLNVQVQMNERADATICLVNMNGEILQQTKKELASGSSLVRLDISNVPSGIYLVQIRTAGGINSQRVSVIK